MPAPDGKGSMPPSDGDLHRWVALDTLRRDAGLTMHITASPAERAAVARRLGILGVERLDADVRVAPAGTGGWRLEGRFEAEVTQLCSITLEPFRHLVSESFSELFVQAAELEDDAEIDPDAELSMPIEDGGIDVGEAVAQNLSLAVDPYARSDGETGWEQLAELPDGMLEGAANGGGGPFADLAKLRDKPGRSGP